jgi:hypothetical protein
MPWFVLPRSRGCRSEDRVRLHSRAVRAIEQLYADALPGHLAELAGARRPGEPIGATATALLERRDRAAASSRYQLPGVVAWRSGPQRSSAGKVDKRALTLG